MNCQRGAGESRADLPPLQPIGDESIKALSHAFASGALGNLLYLYLDDNQIGGEGMKVFASAIARGALAKLTFLNLSGNKIGDDGMKAFASAIASGAHWMRAKPGSLASLQRLYLYRNKIGDEGMKAFSSALSSGALPSCTFIGLGGTMNEAKQAVQDALKNRQK